MSGGLDRLAARLASALVGIMALEGALFRQIVPVAVAAALAVWEAARPGDGPAPWLVRTFGRPPVQYVTAREVRLGNTGVGFVAVIAVAMQALDEHPASWFVAAAAGVLGILAAVAGRPAFGLGGGVSRRGG